MAINTDVKVSVIVPVYNVEKYLKECLDSIVNQSLKEIEIIIVDDCSTDNSLKIIKEYANNDNRIKIIEQPENRGQGVARNNALDIAKGEYIAFVDPDDWIELDALETLYQFAKNKDAKVVHFDFCSFNEETKKTKRESFSNTIRKKYNDELKNENYYNWKNYKNGCLYNLDLQSWNRFYKKDFIIKNQIQFASSKRGEDHLFTLGAILLCDKIYYLNKSLYTYRKRMGSTANSVGNDNMLIFNNINLLQNFLKKQSLLEELQIEFNNYVKKVIKWHYNQTPQDLLKEYRTKSLQYITTEDFDKIIEELANKTNFLQTIFSIKNKKENGVFSKVLTIFGIKFVIKKYEYENK